MLMLAKVYTVSLISSTVGIQHRVIYKWVARFNEQRIAGLVDKHGRGRPVIRPAAGVNSYQILEADSTAT